MCSSDIAALVACGRIVAGEGPDLRLDGVDDCLDADRQNAILGRLG